MHNLSHTHIFLVAACRISSNASISACEKAQRWREAAEIFAAASAGGGAGGGDGGGAGGGDGGGDGGEGNSVMQSHRVNGLLFGEIFTGNRRFSHEDHEAFLVNVPLNQSME